jgi:hypothetical protein
MKKTIIGFSCSVILFVTAVAIAQMTGDGFSITKSTIDNGGGTSSGSGFTLTGTIGQPDAGLQISSGGGYLLAGGFWAKAHDVIFRSGFEGD